MALPPTGLTALLYATDCTVESVLGSLDRFGLVSEQALVFLSEVRAHLQKAAAAHAEQVKSRGPGAVGPSLADALAQALVSSPFLSQRGKALANDAGTFAGMGQSFWRVDCLSVALPSQYQLVANSSRERLALPGPSGYFASEESRSWKGLADRSIELLLWHPRAPFPGGPMSAVSEWTERVAGIDVKVMETSLFMGRPQRVLVTHFSFKSPIGQSLLFARGLDRVEFSAILNAIEVRENAIEPQIQVLRPELRPSS